MRFIWSLSDPEDHRFAFAIRLGKWAKDRSGADVRVSPMIIEWESGSTRLGDMSVTGLGGELIARKCIVDALVEAGVQGFRTGPVEVRRTKKRIPPIETDSELVEIIMEKYIDCDLSRSTLEWEKDSEGKPTISRIRGLEHYMSNWCPERKELIRWKVPREAGEGILIHASLVDSPMFFRVRQAPALICCSGELKGILEDMAVSNIEFMEAGETFTE